MKIFQTLQAGRGIAALMVVLYHVGVLVGRVPGLWEQRYIDDWLGPGAYGVDFFFILSGIVIVLAHYKDIDNPSAIPAYLWKRFRRIYPIYWVFLVPTIIKQEYVDTGHAEIQRNSYVVLSSFLLVHIRSLGFNLSPSWTLFHEVLFYLSFATILLHKRLGLVLCTCWLGLSLLFVFPDAMTMLPSTYSEMLFSPFHLLFAFGMLVAWLFKQGRITNASYVFIFGLCVLLVASCLAKVDAFRLTSWWRLLAGVGVASTILAAMEYERTHTLRLPGFVILLGDASYSIYLTHFMVLATIARVGFQWDQRRHLPLAIWVVSMFVVGVAIGVLAHLSVEVPLSRLLNSRRTPKLQTVGQD